MSQRISVGIVDYGMGNLRSIENAIRHVGDYEVIISSEIDMLSQVNTILLPGVGAFPDAMQKLRERSLVGPLTELVQLSKKPTLGICLGMQLLFDSSEEKGLTEGLGWIPGSVKYMAPGDGLRVPHIGWNDLLLKKSNTVFDYLRTDRDFYFVHSLHAVCDEQFVIAEFEYGKSMVAAVQNDNVIGMQFHPEKSQQNGLKALKQFFDWAECYLRGRDA